MKLIQLIDKSLKSLFESRSKKENALKMVEEEAKNKGGGLQSLKGKKYWQTTFKCCFATFTSCSKII